MHFISIVVTSLMLCSVCEWAFEQVCVCLCVWAIPHLQSTVKLENIFVYACKKRKEKKNLPLDETQNRIHCSDMSYLKKKKVHLVCWTKCKWFYTIWIFVKLFVFFHNDFKKECVYFLTFFCYRALSLSLSLSLWSFFSSFVRLTLWVSQLVFTSPVLSLWWVLCMQCFENTVGNMGRNWY